MSWWSLPRPLPWWANLTMLIIVTGLLVRAHFARKGR
jgi:hypothetical protein